MVRQSLKFFSNKHGALLAWSAKVKTRGKQFVGEQEILKLHRRDTEIIEKKY